MFLLVTVTPAFSEFPRFVPLRVEDSGSADVAGSLAAVSELINLVPALLYVAALT